MALYVALTVYDGTQAAASTSIGVATSGSTGQIFKTIPSITIAGVACISTVTLPATGLNQKPTTYYSASTVAALVALMV